VTPAWDELLRGEADGADRAPSEFGAPFMIMTCVRSASDAAATRRRT